MRVSSATSSSSPESCVVYWRPRPVSRYSCTDAYHVSDETGVKHIVYTLHAKTFSGKLRAVGLVLYGLVEFRQKT